MKKELAKVQRLALLLADQADDQAATTTKITDVLLDITKLLESMDASNALLEARVQMLEADND